MTRTITIPLAQYKPKSAADIYSHLLDLLSDGPRTLALTEIAEASGYSREQAGRSLAHLIEVGVIQRTRLRHASPYTYSLVGAN